MMILVKKQYDINHFGLPKIEWSKMEENEIKIVTTNLSDIFFMQYISYKLYVV
jgi:hypothetical protein